MAKIVPLISSGVAGPLGVLHLPRLWQKVSLEAAGKLAAGYPCCGDSYDQMVLAGLGLEKEATLDYICTAAAPLAILDGGTTPGGAPSVIVDATATPFRTLRGSLESLSEAPPPDSRAPRR